MGEAGLSEPGRERSTLLLIPLSKGKWVRPDMHAGQLAIPGMSWKHPHSPPWSSVKTSAGTSVPLEEFLTRAYCKDLMWLEVQVQPGRWQGP